jgi:hypothetical protein
LDVQKTAPLNHLLKFQFKKPAPLMISSEAMAIIWIGEFNTAHSFIGTKAILTMREKEKRSRIMSQKT